jgi:predicted NUDIX family NTP pyrophosphohydrolase
MASRKLQSAGLLLFRGRAADLEVLLGHPGGPFWQNKDDGAWSIPKGLIGADEAPLSAARREFAEEIGYLPDGDFLPLGEALQPGGKLIKAWAIEGDWDPALIQSTDVMTIHGSPATLDVVVRMLAKWFSRFNARGSLNDNAERPWSKIPLPSNRSPPQSNRKP